MDTHEKRQLIADIGDAPEHVRTRIVHYVRSNVPALAGGSATELEVDLNEVPEETLLMVSRMVRKRPHPVDSARRQRESVRRRAEARAAHLARLSDADFSSLHWFARLRHGTSDVRERGIRPGRETARLLADARASGAVVVADPPTVVLPRTHFGRSVGFGLVALVPFVRGQFLTQFTGTLHERVGTTFYQRGRRADYVIKVRHAGRAYVVDPLDAETSTRVVHTAAYINEPSAPPFARMTNARHEATGRNVLVHRYVVASGELDVEFADGARARVPPEALSTEETRRDPHPPYRANCMWYDFPAPLEDLYAYRRDRHGMRLYRRTTAHACEVDFRDAAQILAVFEAHTNLAYTFELTRARIARVEVGDVLTLRDEVFHALHRNGVVVARTPLRVRFVLNADEAFRLPDVAYAATSAAGTDVPFPVVHACADVVPGQELLCLYAQPIAGRGAACAPPLDDFLPPWYAPVR